MKNLLPLPLAALMIFGMAACGPAPRPQAAAASQSEAGQIQELPVEPGEAPEAEPAGESDGAPEASITVTALNGARENIQLEVPYNPQRVAVMDLAVLDILDNLGMGERVVGVSKRTSIDYLQGYMSDEEIRNLGTIKEADMEAVMACEPDVIFIGGRLASMYDALSEIAPVIFLTTDVEEGVVKSTRDNAMLIASLFGAEDAVSTLLADYDARIQALATVAAGKNAVVGMVNAGALGVLGNEGRCSVIGVEIGFENLNDSEVTSTHGNESSFELLVELDPDYIFVMDRDAAIGTEGAQLAREVMENELVMMTTAYGNGNIVYLEHSNVWYTAEGGITALGIMLSDLETELLA